MLNSETRSDSCVNFTYVFTQYECSIRASGNWPEIHLLSCWGRVVNRTKRFLSCWLVLEMILLLRILIYLSVATCVCVNGLFTLTVTLKWLTLNLVNGLRTHSSNLWYRLQIWIGFMVCLFWPNRDRDRNQDRWNWAENPVASATVSASLPVSMQCLLFSTLP